MQIEKWYLDCVTPAGAGMMGYATRISCGPLAVCAAETLVWQADHAVPRSRTALGGRLPTTEPGQIRWRSEAVHADGRWNLRGDAIATLILHEEAAGRIEWTCYCPAAQAAVSVGTEQWDGHGYAERLVLTLPPARLPIRELRWGRFITDDQSCVWIQWDGPIERSWCFHNGQPVDASKSGDQDLAWAGHCLRLDRGMILRTGRLADAAFRRGRLLRRLIPTAIRDLYETKWRSRGVLTDSAGDRHAGWAIHELAIFP